MRLTAILALVVLVAGLATARADDKAAIDEVNKAAVEFDEAFKRQDAAAIEKALPADHLAVTAYYDSPQTPADQIKSLPDLKFTQTVTGDVTTELLGPDVALRSFTAKLGGTYKGKPVPSDVFVGELWVKGDGVWRQRFYQVTAFKSKRAGKSACKDLLGTYLTKNTAKDGSFSSRSLLSFAGGGLVLFTDSGQSGEEGFAPFTDGSGVWRCVSDVGGTIKAKATTLDFTSRVKGSRGEIGRLDFDLSYRTDKKAIEGTATLYIVPLNADPFRGGVTQGRAPIRDQRTACRGAVDIWR